MKKKLLYMLFCLVPFIAKGQGENNNWTFCPEGNSSWVINFSTGTPVIQTVPMLIQSGFACSVSYPNGQLRFIFRLTGNTTANTFPEVFLPNGTPVANSNLLSGTMTDGCMPLVVPRPGNPDQYYLIYSYSNGLIYSLLDMSLNNGAGAVIAAEKDKVISPYGTVSAEKLGAIPGCDGVWIITRSRLENKWLSFHITASGIDTSAVVSTAGNFTSYDYGFINYLRRFKTSTDGSKMATVTWKGIELYDFEKCSGKLKNARVVDTTGNVLPFGPSTSFNNHTFGDVCFSPDGTKLYATFNEINVTTQPGRLYQYDLSQPSLVAIISSRALIMTNQPSIIDVAGNCAYILQNPLGGMKIGPNGKMYVDNGSITCRQAASVPIGFNPGAAFHTIDYPNLAGAACQPNFNTLMVNGTVGQGASFYFNGYGGSQLQQNIVVPFSPPDTIQGNVYNLIACFADSLLLQADSNAGCYHWDNGDRERNRYVRESGTYFLRYFKDCNYATDTFHVNFAKLPYLGVTHQSCPGRHLGSIAAYFQDDETYPFRYTWRATDGTILRQNQSASGDVLSGLAAGTYYVEIQSASGCDTVLSAEIQDMPKPLVSVSPADTTIRYGDSIMLFATGAQSYSWQPAASVLENANTGNPLVRPLEPTFFTVVGSNQYGCEDTGRVNINLDYHMPVLIPNAFSPNGDGMNDVFKVEGFTYQSVKRFYVFNRYGQLVFSTMDGNKGWDGIQNGKPCDAGTYFYNVEIAFPDGSSKVYKGDITLIR